MITQYLQDEGVAELQPFGDVKFQIRLFRGWHIVG
jgi:hypothetical protein